MKMIASILPKKRQVRLEQDLAKIRASFKTEFGKNASTIALVGVDTADISPRSLACAVQRQQHAVAISSSATARRTTHGYG